MVHHKPTAQNPETSAPPFPEETIAAIATPIGQAGIGIIRISGSRALEIARKIFKPRKRETRVLESHRLYLGWLYDPSSEAQIDEILLSFMKAPHSYTREDVVEINSHSGYLLLSKILQIVLAQGARLAKPGEFTLRAFLNGRIDLTQAEAVMDLINAKSERGLVLASQQIQGSFKTQIDALRQRGVEILANIETAIDFPEDEIDLMPGEEVADQIERNLVKPMEGLAEAHVRKRIWIDGINTVIVGRVNAGKSSLLNRLLDEERAIVTPVPGTTRDIVESTVSIDGLPLRLMDTAGFREGKDEVERIGIHLTRRKLAEADLALIVIDQSRPLDQDDMSIVAQVRGKTGLIVLNKMDLAPHLIPETIREIFPQFPLVAISALTGQGLDHLRNAIVKSILEGELNTTSSQAIPTNLRHGAALKEAVQCFRRAVSKLREGAPLEIVAVEVKGGLDALGQIIGDTSTEEILESIFSRFCIGK